MLCFSQINFFFLFFCIFLYFKNFKDFFGKIKNENIENMFLEMLKLMYIVFTYGDYYVGKQAICNCEDAVRSCILFWKKVHLVKVTSVVPMCVDFLSILMRVNFINVPKIIFYQISVYIWK